MGENKMQAIAESVAAMINEPHEVTEHRRVTEIQEQAAAIRNAERPEGRYTIGEAVILI